MNQVKKPLCMIVFASLVLLGFAGTGAADQYDFEDLIDHWGPQGTDAVLIVEGRPLHYEHDVTDSIDFLAGDYAIDAWLELDFTNDVSDFNLGLVDLREFARFAYDGSAWIDIGEVDNGQYNLALDLRTLNIDGRVAIDIQLSNPGLIPAVAWLDHSRVYGTADTAPVPEPASLVLLGSGLVALGLGRKKFKKS